MLNFLKEYLSLMIIGFFVTTAWRAGWYLEDQFFFSISEDPNNLQATCICSWVISLVLLLFFLIIQTNY